MPPTSRLIRDELDNLLAYLIEAEIAVHVNPVLIDLRRVTWVSPSTEFPFLADRDTETLATYRSWLVQGAYSALLFDGSMLQVTYDFEGHDLVGHRLAWIPCPFKLDYELFQVGAPTEVVDLYVAEGSSSVVLRTAIRFDYDPERAMPGHPAVHLSLNSSDCRIPCAAPLRLGHFIDFIFRHFYPSLWAAHPYLNRLTRAAWGEHLVTAEERTRLHVYWQR